MPESLRQRIEAAIVQAKDEAQRVMLMLMLSLFDTVSETKDHLGEMSASLNNLVDNFGEHAKNDEAWRSANFHDIPPDVHRDDHDIVNGIRIERRKNKELVTEAKKGFAGGIGQLIATGLVAAMASLASVVVAMRFLGGG